MNHLNMTGDLIFPNLALFMVFQIPVWMLVAKFLSKKLPFSSAEILSSVTIGIVAVQPWYFPKYWEYVRLPTVDSGTKNEMMVWYVALTSNLSMAVMTAVLFISVSWIFKKK